VRGTVNLYAATQRAFVGSHDKLGNIFGAWAAGAVSNADLALTRREAETAPDRVQDRLVIDVAIGITASRLGIDVETAKARLDDAAARGGVSLSQLAEENRHGPREPGPSPRQRLKGAR
jgi:hypothetical protein